VRQDKTICDACRQEITKSRWRLEAGEWATNYELLDLCLPCYSSVKEAIDLVMYKCAPKKRGRGKVGGWVKA
jgi:hypothetical protein